MKNERLVVPFEVKTLGDGDARTFEGYGSVFGVLDSYADIVAPGAFKRSLKEAKASGRLPALLWQHDASAPIGVYESMQEDDTGLFVKGRLSDTQLGREAYTLLKDGALSGLSIGFITRKSKVDNETGVRTLTDIQLWETSLVTFPANDAARITGVKTAGGDLPSEREFERWLLREGGLSAREAETIIAKGYRTLKRGGSMPSDEACVDLIGAIRRFGSIAGDQRHGTSGSQSGA